MTRYYRYRSRLTPRQVAAGAAIALLMAGGAQGAVHAAAHPRHAAVVPVSGNEALANRMAAHGYGWTGRQARCLDWLWTRESAGTWSPAVWNYGGSGAYGIPQSLPAWKMASAGPDWRTNAATQIRWGLGDIARMYGSPCAAWSHEKSAGWY